MTLTIDYSFHKDCLIRNLIPKIKDSTSIKSIKYSRNYEWATLEHIEELDSIAFEQLVIETDQFDIIYFQLFENNLPRVFAQNIRLDVKEKYSKMIEGIFLERICFCTISETTDTILQNVETPDSWRRKKRHLPEYIKLFPNPIYTNERERELISLESLPGHSHLMNYDEKLWFGSCWKMYFSPIYYKYIPKFLFDDFKECFENKVLENGLRMITLFENPEDYDLPLSRDRQWTFRRALGIDSIAHELRKQNNRIEPEDLPVKISKEKCVKGTTRVELFIDSKKTIREFYDDGINVVYEE